MVTAKCLDLNGGLGDRSGYQIFEHLADVSQQGGGASAVRFWDVRAPFTTFWDNDAICALPEFEEAACW